MNRELNESLSLAAAWNEGYAAAKQNGEKPCDPGNPYRADGVGFDRADRMLRRALYAEAELADLRSSIKALVDEGEGPHGDYSVPTYELRDLLGRSE